MQPDALQLFCCPACHTRLVYTPAAKLSCTRCSVSYPLIQGIPRFVNSSNYAATFGLQWHMRSRTQHDEHWQRMYRERFASTTGFPADLHGEVILEAGCGSGAFTGIALERGATVYSFDLSTAVEVCKSNHADAYASGRLILCQADIYALPFAAEMFDRIFCLGVLQHTPDPHRSVLALARYLKPGGELALDCYQQQSFPHLSMNHVMKHALRIITRHIPPRVLFPLCQTVISVLYDLKVLLNRLPYIGEWLQCLIPIGKLQRHDWTAEQMKEIKSLNVFDMLSPRYDKPQSVATIHLWLVEAGLEVLKCTTGQNGVNAVARRPSSRKMIT